MILLPAEDPAPQYGQFAAFGGYYDGTAPTTIVPQYSYNNNTMGAKQGNPPTDPGFGGEGAGANTMVQGVWNNIDWFPAVAASPTLMVLLTGTVATGTFQPVNDFNLLWNATAGGGGGNLSVYGGGATSAYAATPGAHDQTANPVFVDPSRSWQKWCTMLNSADTTWDACEARFADLYSPSHDARYTIAAALAWVTAGFAPQSPAARWGGCVVTSGSCTGVPTWVGAVKPVLLFPMGGVN
jgi:hypothetical protein